MIVFVHGGGWYAGDRAQFGAWADHAARRGHRAASLGYRTQEGSSYRDKVDDLVAGLGVVSQEWPDAFGICLVGSSAGAHLVTALALGEAPTDDTTRLPVVAVVSANGPGSMRPESLLQAQNRIVEMGMSLDEIELLDRPPTGQAAADWLFLLAERETYFPHEHVAALAARLEGSGSPTTTVVVPDTDHGFIYGALSGPAEAAALSASAMDDFWDRIADQAEAAASSSHQMVDRAPEA